MNVTILGPRGLSRLLTSAEIQSTRTGSEVVSGCLFFLTADTDAGFVDELGPLPMGTSPLLPTRTRVDPSDIPYEEMVSDGSFRMAPLWMSLSWVSGREVCEERVERRVDSGVRAGWGIGMLNLGRVSGFHARNIKD